MERFFLTGSSFDESELKELLIRRYHSLDFIKDMELVEFIHFCNFARKKDREDRLYQQWCAMLPQMAEYHSFEWFRDTMTGTNIDWRSTEEIIADIEETHRKAGMTSGT